jgi:predicted ATPase
MISKVSIRNFKCLRDIQVELEQFTVFVGPNASGKSSILQALNLLCLLFHTEPPNQLDNELNKSRSQGATEQIELAAELGGKAYRYRPGLPFAQPNPRQWTGQGRGVATSLAASDWEPWKAEPRGSPPLPLSTLLRLETSKLVVPTPAQGLDPTTMAPDGTGLHSALANIALSDPEAWQKLQDHLRQIVPTVRRLRATLKGPNNFPALLFDMQGADSLAAWQISEGTLLVLGLLTALHAPGHPNLVLLDDLDRGLHPKAQRELMTLLRGLQQAQPDLQIVATTHSPYMLDCMAADEVRMTLLDGGATVCAPLTSHPKFPKWKDEMTPGEMWSLFGEKWLAEREVPA